MAARPRKRSPSHDRPALHGNAGNILITRIAQVRKAHIGPQPPSITGKRDIPHGISRSRRLLSDTYLRMSRKLVKDPSPGGDGVLRGIVESVFRDKPLRWRRSPHSGVAKVEVLIAAKAQAQLSLCPVVVEVADVGRLPRRGERVFGVVDAVLLVKAEAGGRQRKAAVRRRPVNAPFIAPG